ncbi:hypothetical protein BIY24_08265 [Halobacteriovorax marinus]|nr:hypothetical protein BIY24_08265 [Halobacteriovorax marinus]
MYLALYLLILYPLSSLALTPASLCDPYLSLKLLPSSTNKVSVFIGKGFEFPKKLNFRFFTGDMSVKLSFLNNDKLGWKLRDKNRADDWIYYKTIHGKERVLLRVRIERSKNHEDSAYIIFFPYFHLGEYRYDIDFFKNVPDLHFQFKNREITLDFSSNSERKFNPLLMRLKNYIFHFSHNPKVFNCTSSKIPKDVILNF